MARLPQLCLHLLLLLPPLAGAGSLVDEAEDPLLDIKGNPVKPGVEYYLVSAVSGGGGGGVRSRTISSFPCPAYVGQEGYEADYGSPVTLESVNNPNASTIKENEKVAIQFSTVETCHWSPTVWTVEESDGRELLATGGDPPKFPPPLGIGNNMFLFGKKGEFSYTLSYCRCNLCEQMCDPVSKTSIDGGSFLNVIPSGETSEFPVLLVKVGDQSEHSSHLPSSSS